MCTKFFHVILCILATDGSLFVFLATGGVSPEGKPVPNLGPDVYRRCQQQFAIATDLTEVFYATRSWQPALFLNHPETSQSPSGDFTLDCRVF